MPIAPDGSWFPSISKKQDAVRRPKAKYLLVTGPRRASKTIGCLHAIIHHMWNTDRSRGMMLGRTTTDNYDGGAWRDLTETILDEWLTADFGLELVTPPKMEVITHKMFFETNNKYGTTSRFYLDSLDVEEDVERKFRGKRFDLIYCTELSNFKARKTFDVLEECLRMTHLPASAHQLIADTNPADEGQDSWIWKLWYDFRTVDLEKMDEEQSRMLGLDNATDPVELEKAKRGLREFQANLGVEEFTIDDNIFLTEEQKRAQRVKYSHNKDMFDRYYLGKWVRATGESIFQRTFIPSTHIIGHAETLSEPEECMLPDPKCIELGVGWDIGGRFTAVAIVEKLLPEVDGVVQPVFKVLDEFVNLGENMSVETVVGEVMEKMRFWERQLGKKVLWRHWSDRSSFDRYDNIADTFEHVEVYNMSGGEIQLQAAVKKGGSVMQRINLLQKLLFEDRIFISARCVRIIEMFNSLKKTRIGTIDKGSIYKHALDALSYYVSMETWSEMENQLVIPVGTTEGVMSTKM